MKRPRPVFFAFAVLAAVGATFFLSGGFFADRLASLLLSRQLGYPTECRQAHFKPPREIVFSSLKIYSEDKRLLLSSSEGGLFLGRRITGLHLRHAVFHEAAFGMFSAGGAVPWLGAVKKPLAARSLRLLMDRKKEGRAVHFVAKGETGAVYLRGGFRFASGRFLKGHALVRIPGRWLETLPEMIRPGGLKKVGGGVEFKVFARENSFRLTGERGPLLEAGWR